MSVWKRSLRQSAEPTDGESIPGYEDLEPIGRGGFSVVYRAHQQQLDRTVAVKVLSINGIDARAKQEFRREVQLAGKLSDHPNVVTVLESGETGNGRPYLAMEYYERGSTHDLLEASGPLPVADVLRIGTKIASALAAAHRLGITHSDVKPHNILLSNYGEPALADLATAQMTVLAGIKARAEAITLVHSAPELLQGRSATPASDVYSLGSTLFHLLAGRAPYRGDEGVASLLLRMQTEAEPRLARADVSPATLGVMRRAMARNPADRFPDAQTLLQALQELQRELGFVVTSTTSGVDEDRGSAVTPVPSTASVAEHPNRTLVAPATQMTPADFDDDYGDYTIAVPTRRTAVRRLVLVLGGLAAVAVALSVPILLAQPANHPTETVASTNNSPHVTQASPSTGPTRDSGAVTAPSGVLVTDAGTAATLRWTLGAGSEVYPVLVQLTPVAGKPTLVPLPNGTRTYTASPLDTVAGYCFQVGLLLELGDATRPALATWSAPVCIRGAFAVGTNS